MLHDRHTLYSMHLNAFIWLPLLDIKGIAFAASPQIHDLPCVLLSADPDDCCDSLGTFPLFPSSHIFVFVLLLQYVWERLLPGFKHKNFRSREGICFCLSATLSTWVASPSHVTNFLGKMWRFSQILIRLHLFKNILLVISKHVIQSAVLDLHQWQTGVLFPPFMTHFLSFWKKHAFSVSQD